MNERIEKLTRQVEAAYIPRYDMWQMDSGTLQKFAELIVKECADIAQQHNKSPVSAALAVGYVIREHFGVTE